MRGFERLIVFCVILIVGVAASADEIDVSLRDEFLNAMRQVPWKSHEVSFRVKGTASRELYGKRETEVRNCAIRGRLGLQTGIDERGIEYVVSKNNEYAFQLNRADSTKAYTLNFVEQLDAGSVIDPRIHRAENEMRALPFAGWYLMLDTVESIVTSPTFQFRRVAAERRDGRNLVRIEFDRKLSDPMKRGSSFSPAYMVCDPERHWAMVEYGMTSFDGLLSSRTSLTYGGLVDGLPIAKTITHRSSSTQKDDKVLNWESIISVEVIGDDVPREEFYLSHYGLAEPNFKRTWFGTWFWYLIAGIVCVGAGSIIAKRGRVRRN